MLFRNYGEDGPTYFEVRQINYQWQCTCNQFKLERDCNHIRTVVNEQMAIDNEIIDCPSYERTIQESLNHFHGKPIKQNKTNSSPWYKPLKVRSSW